MIIFLPAILKREFVWKPEQILPVIRLFAAGYPFEPSFWKKSSTTSESISSTTSCVTITSVTRRHCESLSSLLVIASCRTDGQQRMTKPSTLVFAILQLKTQGKWWSSPDAFIERRLYLNFCWWPVKLKGACWRFSFLK